MPTVQWGSPMAQRFGGRDQAPAWGARWGGPCGLPTQRPLPATAEDLSDSDEVFAKEMTKWSSNDFLDTLERPAELDDALGEWRGGSGPKPWCGHPGRGLTPIWTPQLGSPGPCSCRGGSQRCQGGWGRTGDIWLR